ncbi:MAG TPA: retropepsin-like aspartic protease [Steroidobacteraceae bacterium]|nr:retropepsin-like aspartic protease [Steroidobacteraceae bacterium]
MPAHSHHLMARILKFLTVALLGAGPTSMPAPAYACDRLDPDASSVTGTTRNDSSGRAVALININGQGPFRFIIDTGANRSVLSEAVATRLGLAHSGVGMVHSVDGAELAALVNVDSLSFGALHLSGGETPVLDGPMLDGAHGLLGVDGMAGRLLHVDFTKHCVEIYEAAAARMPTKGWLSVPALMRFGSMLMIEGDIMGVRVNVLIDTGSDISLANEAFRDALRKVGARTVEYHNGHAFTFGRPIVFTQRVWTPRLYLGRTVIGGVDAFIGNFHIFDFWGLQNEPTLLIGMDVLARAREMAVDYEHGIVHFRERPRGDYRGEDKSSGEGRPAAVNESPGGNPLPALARPGVE